LSTVLVKKDEYRYIKTKPQNSITSLLR